MDFVAACAILGFLVGLVLAIGSWISRRRSADPCIAIIGLSGAGKTSLFLILSDGSLHKGTVTSMEANSDVIHVEKGSGPGSSLRIVDYPGHPRLQGSAKLQTLLGNEAAGCIFVIDALNFIKEARAVSERLFEMCKHSQCHILTVLEISKRRKSQLRKFRMLLCCNKNDRIQALPKDNIRKRLEKDITQMLQSTKAEYTSTILNSATDDVSKIELSSSFKFDISICEISVTESQLEDLREWLKLNY